MQNIIAAGKDKATIYVKVQFQHVEKVRTKPTNAFWINPIGSEATKVKQEERTIEMREFYKKFFWCSGEGDKRGWWVEIAVISFKVLLFVHNDSRIGCRFL